MLTLDIVLVLAILTVAVILFVTEKLRTDVVALLVLLALGLTGLLTPEETLSGFSHPAAIAVIAVFIVGEGLFETGAAQLIGRYVTRVAGRSEVRLTVAIMLAVAGTSAVMDNVGATAVLVPVTVAVARQNNIHPSKLLIPLSFGALQGGLLSLIGRPSNIIVSDILRRTVGTPFGMFDFTPLGLVLLLVGVGYMILIGRKMLPTRTVEDKLQAMIAAQIKAMEQYHLDKSLFEVRVLPESPLANLTIQECRLGSTLSLNVVGIVRNGDTVLSPGPKEPLRVGDLLLVQGRPEEIVRLRWTRGVEVEQETTHWQLEDLLTPDLRLVEAVLTVNSSYIGHTLREVDFRRKHSLTVLAIWRDGRPYRTGLGNIRLKFGDTLLLQGTRSNIHLLSRQPDLLVLSDEHETGGVHAQRAPVAALILLLMIGLVGFDVVPVAIGSLLAAVLMILAGCLTIEDAYLAIDWRVFFLMAGMLPLGLALEKTGSATYLAQRVITLVGGWGPLGLLAGIFFFNFIASQMMSSVAATALIAPIAVSTAQAGGTDPRAFLMAVAVSGSMAFLTPIGHQANMLVMGPGGYRFADYARVGLLLAVLLFVISIVLLPVFFPL
jgi:di/tricarboxylate transporter